ncbi:3-oxoacyl-ACP reductase [Ktedonobacteria bacterium brp13]|nr:3-oxoacyl-ACP reductase [Ktedonobacteria bacterium brp13]
MSKLNGKVALVTGGGRGIGRATALLLAQEGCDVAILARTPREIEQVASEIRAMGQRSIALTSDLSDNESIARACTALAQQFGPVDILMNNAGVVEPLGRTETVDLDQWSRAIHINLVGPFQLIQACLPTMLERGWGRIVNVSTGAAAGTGMKNANAYAVSKSGLEMLTVNLAAELAGTGVMVNAIHPGAVNTAMLTHVRSQPAERVGQETYERFKKFQEPSATLDPIQPARLLVNLVKGDSTGEIVSLSEKRGQELLAAQL